MSENEADIKELIRATSRIEQKLDTTHSWVKDLNSRVVILEKWMWYACGISAAVVFLLEKLFN